jgi:hypothetical protein
MDEKKYPVYRFTAVWDQDDYQDNATGTNQMFKERPSEEELSLKLEEFKANIIKKHPSAIFKKIEYKYVEDETWVLKWFCHFTYNKFDKDSDAVDSFADFVSRKEEIDYCLMGAEDRYRWEVCHCEHCQKGDWTIVNH